jgi:large subunit ribosomal protein L6
MSRIGKKPIPIPKGVKVSLHDEAIEVTGPKGTLRQAYPPGIGAEVDDAEIRVRMLRDDPALGKFHGLGRSLIANAVLGVSEGFKRELDIVGIGYRAEVKDRKVTFALGYSHPIVLDVPAEIEITVERNTHITVTGIDKQRVGQVAANIRSFRKPDPYKQKGVRYTGEVLKMKVGKKGA